MAKDWKPLKCEKCQKTFLPYSSKQKLCQNPCTTKGKRMTIAEANQAWLNTAEKKPKCKKRDMVHLRFLGN